MLGEALAKILRSQLGQYLDTEDLEVRVAFGKPIELKNVKLRESALRDANLPLRCVYGKVEQLSIEIPWTNPYGKPTVININGLYMLIVPTTSVGYDQEREDRAEQEAKMAKIAVIEEAKHRDRLLEKDDGGDSFMQKLLANIFKNLVVTVTDVHIRYEDKQTNQDNPFGAGLTLDRLEIRTSNETKKQDGKKSFNKEVLIASLAVYWQPRERVLYSENSYQEDEVRDIQFKTKIARRDSGCKGLKYLLGPISMEADLTWVPNPKRVDFTKPQIDLKITMAELKLNMTKHQYHDFAMLLHSLNTMTLAARYRKYKAANHLENVTNFKGRGRDLWKYAMDSILEEEIRPKLKMWSPSHIRDHLARCKEYRDRYKDKLLGETGNENDDRLKELEMELDAFNINISRERAEILADNKRRMDAENSSGWFGWMWNKKKPDNAEGAGGLVLLDQAYQSLSQDDKRALYEAIDYHEEAEEGTLEFPKRFVKFKVRFQLGGFVIKIQDEDLPSPSSVLTLILEEVQLELQQRPAASNFLLAINMENLTVTGLHTSNKKPLKLISTVKKVNGELNLLNFEFEMNPPANPGGDLDEDKGSLYDRKLNIFTSPLEIVYDTKTIFRLVDVFKSPEEVKIDYLQESAIDTFKEYKDVKMSQLGWEFARENHVFFNVNIELQSSYFIFPKKGEYYEGCPALIANLGSVIVKSKEVTEGMVNSKKNGTVGSTDFEKKFKENLLDQAYDKFCIALNDMELLLAKEGENWRQELLNPKSKLFLLKPINLEVNLRMCLIPNDPDFPVYKLSGQLPKGIEVCIEEKRLMALAEIAEDILDPDDDMKYATEILPLKRNDSEGSFASAVSSIGTIGSGYIGRKQVSTVVVNVPHHERKEKTFSSKVTKLEMDFSIKNLQLDIEEDEKLLFSFQLEELSAKMSVKNYNMQGEFGIGGCLCQQAKFKMPDASPVALLSTKKKQSGTEKLLLVKVSKLGEKSPNWSGVHLAITASMSSVNLCLHQDAILDLAKEATTWISKIQAKASKLIGAPEEVKSKKSGSVIGSQSPHMRLSRQGVVRRLSRQSSGEASTNMGKSIKKPRITPHRRAMSSVKEEAIDLQITANLKGVSAILMTSKINFATVEVQDLETDLKFSRSKTEIFSKLRDFKIFDLSNSTRYRMLAESLGQDVFNVTVCIYDMLGEKDKEMGRPDVLVKAEMGQLKFVFLMKFITDFLLFIDPFTNMKEFIYEQTLDAYDKTTKLVGEAYQSATRVKLDIEMAAPIIILPVSSRKPFTFEANLGKLKLQNHHHSTLHYAHTVLLDTMSFRLSDMSVSRSKIADDKNDNSTLGTSNIIQPISFDLEITRNMEGAFKEADLPEISVNGTLYEIRAEISKDDYNTLIAMVMENFQEKGVLEAAQKTASMSNKDLNLPIESRTGPKYTSQLSISSRKSRNSESFDVTKGKSSKAKLAEFTIILKGFKIRLYKDNTNLTQQNAKRDQRKALAQIEVNNLTVKGDYRVSGALRANAALNDVVLEDVRPTLAQIDVGDRIVRLLESKKMGEQTKDMITVKYTKDHLGMESVDCHISSFVVVASVSYLIEIANFFIPEDLPDVAFSGDVPPEGIIINDNNEAAVTTTRTVLVKMEEPDIVLVNNIEDINTDALMLNAELSINLTQQPDRLSFVLTVDRLRGHTCKFNPAIREQTLAQILQPTNMGMHFSQDSDANRTRIDINFNHLVLNVSPASIYIIYNSYNTFMENLSNLEQEQEDSSETGSSVLPSEGEHLWGTTAFSEEDVWYLKPDEAVDPLGRNADTVSLASTVSLFGDQQLMFNINQLIVTVEAGLGNNTIPMILVESKLSGEVRNWSDRRMSVLATTQLEMAYYNSKFALWEPVIEPIGYLTNTGRTAHNRWSLDIRYQNNSPHDLGSAILSPNFTGGDEPDGFVCPENLPPLTDIGIHSTETLQITITKSFLAVLNSLSESFSPSALEKISSKEAPMEPFKVVNKCGRQVTLVLGEHRNFTFYQNQEQTGMSVQPEIEPGAIKALNLRFNRHSTADNSYRTYVSPLRNQSDQSEATLKMKVHGETKSFEVPVNKADTRFFKFPYRGSEYGDEQGIVSTVHVENGTKYVTLTSILTFKNNYPGSIKIWQESNQRFQELHTLEKSQTWNTPISNVYTETGRFYFSLDGSQQNMGLECVSWREIGKTKGSYRKKIQCTNTNSEPDVYLNIEGTSEEIFNERSSDLSQTMYNISIRPSVVLKNCLPMSLHYACGDASTYSTLEEGQIGCLEDMRHGQTLIRFNLFGWRQVDLQCIKVFEENMKQLEYWRFESTDPTVSSLRVDLGVIKDVSKGTVVLSIFAPFWFVNKTQKRLYFKGHDGINEIVHYPEEEKVPMMFSYISKSWLGKKKISMKVDNSLWSDPFTVDTIGDTGKITCKLDARRGSLKRNFKNSEKRSDDAFNVGIQISQSSSSFTKIVTFTPYYMIFNAAQFDIILKEVEDEMEGVTVPVGQCVPFWPIYGGGAVVCQAKDYPGVTVPFSLSEQNPTLLMLSNKCGGIDVSVKTDNSSQTLVTLSGYKAGQAPVLLVNNTPTWTIQYGEQGSQNKKLLGPGEKVLFTWEKPSGARVLHWSVDGIQGAKVYENGLKTDDCDAFRVGTGQFAWVSFLDGMQRVLLFTNQPLLAQQLAKTTGESERIEQEIDISIYGVGLSLINNDSAVRRELAYLSVTSSDIVWEIRKEGKQRYKSLTQGHCQAIEHDFMVYSRMLAIGKSPAPRREIDNGAVVVNYIDEKMEAPFRGKIKRQFQKGLWFQMRTSQHQRQFHLKVNHVQLDNQLAECLYPVIAAPVPPPRSVTAVSVPKPFIELSILEYTSPEHNMKQYKYIHALVQEMHLKVELGFINALSELFEEEEILEENTGEKLELDLDIARKELKEHAIMTVTQGKKDFYDYLHLSPLKVHVSFSLTSYNARRDGTSVNRGSNFINLLLQSFGVTITDSNDIIFRLAYFERKHQFFGWDDLVSEMNRHYTSQAIKQMYVILLGLDVIGNPFGLAVGVARSVEDLFYEPFQGAVEGPSEFAEGLAIGVRSVFSGVVGGAAGTVSKITGALGKGLASLTFDEKFQQKRREAIKRRGHQDNNLAVGMARNTRDLGMGFLGGISGVVLKPIEGAKDEGFGGFFKGVGKGVAGLVTRPTGGIVDFASGTFDTVKRATEVNDEFSRARPARYIHPDGVVRYYDKKEAVGARLVRQVDKGRLAQEIYMLHENIIDNREIFLLTHRRVLYIQSNTVMGGWSSDWEYEYSAIQGIPTIERGDGGRWFIIIHPKEERKTVLGLFGKGSGKKIFLPEGSTKETAQFLARIIEDLRTCQNNFEPVFMRMILQKSK